ncbi:bifunctional protein-disulfide isomerase/oxidoreductase DsbC [Halopseudomonas nanhaiensis]|nr:bifunctional protein-disulfide isomerase/oxidoreductase DsbC [Halopseudomonas nanhaiensis]UAW97778.1 bifunctional protein-disulfide isomerase/oxidoreductase DsbC [Halopseudomonas nanhaiensis]
MLFKRLAGCALALAAMNASADPEQAIQQTLDRLQFPAKVSAVSQTPIAGLYQVELENGRVLYASDDGKYMMQGSLFDVSTEQPRNLTAAAEAEARGTKQAIDAIPQEELVIFAPDKPKTHVTVFTDVDCGYCRKLHSEIEELNELGIEVRYAAFPRSGMGNPVADTMQSIWCADDKQTAMTRAKQGKSVKSAKCDDPVAKQFELGQKLGVQGTPAIFLANGIMLPGYKPAEVLAAEAMAYE